MPKGRMYIPVAMTTCDRGQFGSINYLDQTMRSLTASGFFEQFGRHHMAMFDAGPGHDRAAWLAETYDVQAYGADDGFRFDVVRNTHRAMAWMAGQDAEHALLLQDDVRFCKNWYQALRDWLAGMAPEDAAVVSLATQYAWTQDPGNLAKAWGRDPKRKFYGCWAVLFRRDFLIAYLTSQQRQLGELRTQNVDLSIRYYTDKHPVGFYAHCPNLVEHIGMQSSLGHRHDHHGNHKYFPGEEWDAAKRELA